MKINKEAMALPLAVVGMVLGIVNTYWALTSSIVHLSVQPYPVIKRDENILMLPSDPRELKDALNGGIRPEHIVIRLTNTGRATVWVTGVGFIDKAKSRRFYLVSPDLEAKGKFALAPNEPTNIDTKVTPELRKHLKAGVDQAFAETAGGTVFIGSTEVWESYVEWINKPNT